MRALGLCLASLLLVGCASADLTVTRPLSQRVSRVHLTVEPVGDAAREISGAQSSQLRSALSSSLARYGVTLAPADEPDVAALRGEVHVYDEGNRALRYFIGFGAGRGRFASTWVVKDAAGSPVGECRIEGGIVMGAFGGSYHDVVEKVGTRLGQFLRGAR